MARTSASTSGVICSSGRRRHHHAAAEAAHGERHRGAHRVGALADEGAGEALDSAEVLEDGERVGHRLHRVVVVVGEAVDHRDGGVLDQLRQGRVERGARHDRVDQAADDAGRVGQRLVAAQVDLAGAQVLRVAAELGHAGLEADARARRRVLEEHRQGAIREVGRADPPPVEGLEGEPPGRAARAVPRA